jgi:hypothetical protein
MLMPDELGGYVLSNLAEPKRLADEKLSEVPCFRIDGKNGKGDPLSLWIDSTTFIVVKMKAAHDFRRPDVKDDFRTETTTMYVPKLNGKVPPEALTFNPPASKDGSK